MSVIFGIKEKDKIIIAGDKRASTISGEYISDDLEKVVEINKSLCIASAGNVAISEAILIDVNKTGNPDVMRVDDLIEIIRLFYCRVVENECDSIYALPFYCLIAGMGNDGKGHLVNAGKFKNGFDYKEYKKL